MLDLQRLATALAPVEAAARTLPWAKERPWRTTSHLWVEGRLPVVDLHDLGRKQARMAVEAAVRLAHDLEAGSLCLVTGQGRRSLGKGVLKDQTAQILQALCAEVGGRYRPAGPGRWVFIADPSKAPANATGALGVSFWLLLAALGIAALLPFLLGQAL